MRDFSQLKICFLAGTLEHGGAERQLYYMLHALCQHGAAPRLLCLDHDQFWEGPIRSLGVPVTWVGQRRSRLARLLRVLSELRSNPPDLLQSQHFFANAYVGLAALLLGGRAIGAMRGEGAAELRRNGRLGSWLNLHLPRLIAANSGAAMKQAIARGVPASAMFFLPNVVDTERFRPAGASVERPLTLVSAGRIVREKRFDRFIAALGRLRGELSVDVRGWIVGPTQDDSIREGLEAQAVNLGLFPGSLRFLGGVANMAEIYPQADICVLTSDFEGTPNVLLEAMASGLPVVAARVGGVPEIIQHGKTGFLFDRDDSNGLAEALVELVKSPALRKEMGRRARVFVEQNHSPERLPALLEDLYELALPSQRPWRFEAIEKTPV